MWIFSPSGLLMPGLVPTIDGKSVANPELTRDGQFELQVRARLRSHLEFFISENFEPLGLEYSAIEATPQMDYNFRFYTTRENLALAVANQVRAIDYVKYKEQSERRGADGKPMYPDGRKFHNVLVRAWSLLTDLNPAGGWYGSYSPSNPHGSKSRSSYSNVPITSSNSILAEHYGDRDEELDWEPTDQEEADAILQSMEGIPMSQWEDFLQSWELDLLHTFHPSYFDTSQSSRKQTRRAEKSKKGRKKFFQKS